MKNLKTMTVGEVDAELKRQKDLYLKVHDSPLLSFFIEYFDFKIGEAMEKILSLDLQLADSKRALELYAAEAQLYNQIVQDFKTRQSNLIVKN